MIVISSTCSISTLIGIHQHFDPAAVTSAGCLLLLPVILFMYHNMNSTSMMMLLAKYLEHAYTDLPCPST